MLLAEMNYAFLCMKASGPFSVYQVQLAKKALSAGGFEEGWA